VDDLLAATVRPIAFRTLLVSSTATTLAILAGVPIGFAIARYIFRGRTLILSFINTGMGLPPVVVGLFVWLLLIRSGPLGTLTSSTRSGAWSRRSS
jgi:tungstate transport system permease protein